MNSRDYLQHSYILSIIAFILLMLATSVALMSQVPSDQEQFETISNAESYASIMMAASDGLRTILFIDALFALAYTAAITFAILGFADNNKPVAWFTGPAIIIVMMLDYWENITMVQSLDILAIGGQISDAHIQFQTAVSALKWHGAAATLFAISFLLPNKSLMELFLVWGTRLGLAFAVPLFVINAFELRELASLLILFSMASGFVLLAIVTRSHAIISHE